jgi:NADH:ubiquinone oxidoreductase, NADH-binding (51 kD) subunit
LYGRPTTINNTETLSSIPVIMRNGGKWFADLGVKNSGGEKLFSMSGHLNNPGNFEIPMGMPFPELLALAGGVRNGRKLKAVIPGGSSVPVLPGDVMMGLTMDYDTMPKRFIPRFGRSHRDGRHHRYGQGDYNAFHVSTSLNPAGNVRRVVKAQAGYTAC